MLFLPRFHYLRSTFTVDLKRFSFDWAFKTWLEKMGGKLSFWWKFLIFFVKLWSFFKLILGFQISRPFFTQLLEFHPPSSCNFQSANRTNNLEFDGAFKRAIKVHIKNCKAKKIHLFLLRCKRFFMRFVFFSENWRDD